MKTAVKTYASAAEARGALDRLRAAGFDDAHVYARGTGHRELTDALHLPDDAARRYVGELEHGRHVVGVRCEESRVEEAIRLLESAGTTTAAGATAGVRAGAAGREEKAVPIVEERLKVGKHAEPAGEAHVRSHVETERVEEPVTLREERVRVERRPVDEKLTPGEADRLFQDRDIDVEAVREEAVVGKEARVVGEVVVDKDVRTRQEKVTGTVRHTEVEVDRGEGADRFEAEARTHFDRELSGQDWSTMRDAYRIGYDLGADRSVTSFDRVDDEARRRFVTRHDASLWPYASRAARHGFDLRRRELGDERGIQA